MSARPAPSDQRKSTRYRVTEDVYVMLKQPQYTELGKLIDISAGGLAFLCINQGDWAEEPFEADILFKTKTDNEENLETVKGLPLQPIAYCRDDNMSVPPGPSGVFTRCGVAFDRLTPEQQQFIDRFINEHTCGSA